MAETALPTQPVAVHVPKRSWRGDVRAVKIVWQRELIRFSQDKLRIVTSLVQPFLFLFVLGTGLSTVASVGIEGVSFRTLSTPACCAWRSCSRRCSPPPRSSGTASSASCAR